MLIYATWILDWQFVRSKQINHFPLQVFIFEHNCLLVQIGIIFSITLVFSSVFVLYKDWLVSFTLSFFWGGHSYLFIFILLFSWGIEIKSPFSGINTITNLVRLPRIFQQRFWILVSKSYFTTIQNFQFKHYICLLKIEMLSILNFT